MIKKILLTFVIWGGLFCTAYAEDSVSIYINGEVMSFEQKPVIENGYTLAPFRSLFEGLNSKVEWNNNRKEVTGERDETQIKLIVGENYAIVEGGKVGLDVPAKDINGSVMVPLRFVAESMNAVVDYDASEQRIDINSTDGIKNINYISSLDDKEISENKNTFTANDLKKLGFILFNRNIDLNGDGKKENIRVRFYGNAYNEVYKKVNKLSESKARSIEININGKALSYSNMSTVNGLSSYVSGADSVTIVDMDKNDNQKEIVVSDDGQGEYYTNTFFSWDGVDINNLGGTAGYFNDYEFAGDGTIIGFTNSKLINIYSIKDKIKLMNKMQLVREQQDYYELFQSLNVINCKTKKETEIREKPNSNSKIIKTLQSGDIFKAKIGTDEDDYWVGVETENNNEGWIKINYDDSEETEEYIETIDDNYEFIPLSNKLRAEVYNFKLLKDLDVRQEAKESSKIINTLKTGEKVNFVSSDELGWIKLKSEKGVEGWIEFTKSTNSEYGYLIKENNLELDDVFEKTDLVNEY